MPDPVTTGALVAAALTAAAPIIGKDVVGPAVKDAYAALKSAISRWAAEDVDKLEAKPDSPARAAVVAEAVDDAPEPDRAALRDLVDQLRAALAAAGQAEAAATITNTFTNYGGQQFNAPGGTQNIGTSLPKSDP